MLRHNFLVYSTSYYGASEMKLFTKNKQKYILKIGSSKPPDINLAAILQNKSIVIL